MQTNIWNAHSNASIKFMSLLPLLVCSNFNWSPYFHISPYVKVLPLCHRFTIFMQFLPFVINDQKGSILDRLRLSMSINGVRIIFPNLDQWNEPIKIERWLDTLIMSLARMYAMPINFYLGLLEGDACHISGGESTHIWEIQYVQLIP